MNKEKKTKIRNTIGTGIPLAPREPIVLNEEQWEELAFPFASQDEELPEIQGVPWSPDVSELDAARVVDAWLPEARKLAEEQSPPQKKKSKKS